MEKTGNFEAVCRTVIKKNVHGVRATRSASEHFNKQEFLMCDKITITVDIRKAKRKHRQHFSGAGQHDNRPKRLRTRQRQFQQQFSYEG